jgi:SAM-dependent methyltransferase
LNDLSAAAWNQRYLDETTPWDLSGPTPEFARLLREKALPPKGIALVPGGGRGHDAILLAQNGYEVDLVDFAPAALQAAQALAASAGAAISAFRQDFFRLSDSGFHLARYDLVLEYTFFCAIDPELRPAYAATVAKLLKPGGLLVGLFFPLASDKAPPPFVVSRAEVEGLFRPYFEIKIEDPRESVKPRAGREFLGIFKRK